MAQTLPDAGALQQQLERERQQQLPRRLAPEKPAMPPAMQSVSGTAVVVREFRFNGNTLLTRDVLSSVVADYRGRPLDFNGLQAAAAAVAEAYRQKGWIVRAYLPAQDIEDGIVTIQIVEAVFGGVRIEEGGRRVADRQVLSLVAEAQATGSLLNADALDRALLLADDLPGITVAATLVPGKAAGETDVALRLADEALFAGELSLDNAGPRSTGEVRTLLNSNLNSPLGIGDRLATGIVHGEGSDYLRLAYTLPVGSDGWRVGANTSYLAYRLIAHEFSGQGGKGSADSIGLEASYPVLRTRLRNLFINLNYDRKDFDNRFAGATTSNYRVDSVTVALNGNLFDDLGGGGANAAYLALIGGKLDLGGSPNQAADAATTRAAGQFSKLRWSLSRQQVITPELSFFAQYSGQVASKNLDSSEKFFLGGAYGVRAYPTNEGGGSDGQMLNLELRLRLPHAVVLTAFHDWGRISVNHDNGFTGAALPNSYSLKGHGLALAWATPLGVNLNATWARREGSNANATAGGNDQDGTHRENRFWLSALLPF